MASSNPRVGEIKLEKIVDRSIVRKLRDCVARLRGLAGCAIFQFKIVQF
jgi:hypothetical protein